MALTQSEIISLADNPERGIDLVINDLETAWFDKRVYINSKTHPVVFAADLIIGTSFGVLNRIDDAISRTFADHARNITDLSKHMGDEEKIGLFGTPSAATLMLGLDVDAFHQLAQPVTVTVGRITTTYQMLLIPKDTEVTFNGFIMAIENGIQIRYKDTSGFQVVYDDTTNNPQAPITENTLVRDFMVEGSKRYLTIDVPVRQLQCIVTEGLTSNQSSGCTGDIEYPDYLYNVRAFLRQAGSNVNREIKVSFDQDTFDPDNATLALIIDTTNGIFNYEIPDVYIQNGLGIGTVSIYTYVTKGVVDKDFRSIPLSEVRVNYQDYRYGSGRLGPYSEGLRNSGGVVWGARTVTSGGSNPRPFLQIKESFLQGKRIRTLPITASNLEGTVEAYDYDAVKTIDYVTGRQYAVTKELIKQENKKFNAPMACFVGSFLTSANNLVASGVVLDNGKRITIPHNVLFDVTDYTTQLVNRLTLNTYLGMSGEELVELTNNKTLVYTPFYYVMDTTNNQAVLRTYHLDAPKFNYQNFIDRNEALNIELGIGSIDIEHQDDGYLITLVTKSSDSYKDLDNNALGAQLSIGVTGSSSLASIAATFYGITQDEERIWQFKLDSKFDLDVNDILYFTNFNMFGSPQVSVGTPLNLTMTFILTMGGDPTQTDTPSDRKLDQSLFDISMIAINETTYSVTLGSRQGSLYSRIRPLVGEGQYKRYETDVPQVYAEDVMKRDPETGKLIRDPDTGAPIIEYRAGEVVYNSNGQPRLLYRAGDFMLDANGEKIQVAPRDLQYHFDFIAFDGVYYFSGDEYDKEFAQATKDYFIEHVGQDMAYFNTRLLDLTGLFYQPRSKIGSKQVLVNSNYEMYLKQDLSFTVVYYLTASGYKNQNLKEALLDATPRILNDALEDATTISTAEFIRVLRENAPPEVVGIKLNALAGDVTVDIISNEDSLSGFSIRKTLSISSDRLVSVKESVDTTFMPHDRSMVNMGPV